jgi:hypothetical protein
MFVHDWCVIYLSFTKCIECMITLFRQRAVRGFLSVLLKTFLSNNLVKASVLWPIMSHSFIIHCPALHYLNLRIDYSVFTLSLFTFWVIMVSLCYCFNLINSHDLIIYDMMMLSGWWYYDTLGGSGHFPWVSLRKDLFMEWPPGITVQPWWWNGTLLTD